MKNPKQTLLAVGRRLLRLVHPLDSPPNHVLEMKRVIGNITTSLEHRKSKSFSIMHMEFALSNILHLIPPEDSTFDLERSLLEEWIKKLEEEFSRSLKDEETSRSHRAKQLSPQ